MVCGSDNSNTLVTTLAGCGAAVHLYCSCHWLWGFSVLTQLFDAEGCTLLEFFLIVTSIIIAAITQADSDGQPTVVRLDRP